MKYDYGQTVRINLNAGANMCAGQIASICGVRRKDKEYFYLVEFSDGQSIEIPENLLLIYGDE